MENKLSVCIFVYNHQKYIKKCIDSVLDQKVTFPFKIYAFEDFSTDRTREILDKVTDNRVIKVYNKRNLGLCKNVYRAINYVDGEYIYFLSGDDALYDEHVLQREADFLDKNPHYASVSGWCEVKNERGKVKTSFINKRGMYTFQEYWADIAPNCYMEMFRNFQKIAKEDIRYIYRAGRNNEEIQFWFWMMSKGKKAIIPYYTYNYNHVNNARSSSYNSTKSSLQMFRDYYRAVTYMRWEKPKHMRNWKDKRRKILQKYLNRALETKQYREYGKILCEALLIEYEGWSRAHQ